jgi:hypothetical protein
LGWQQQYGLRCMLKVPTVRKSRVRSARFLGCRAEVSNHESLPSCTISGYCGMRSSRRAKCERLRTNERAGVCASKRSAAQPSSNASVSSAASANSGSVNAGMSSGSAFNAALTNPVDARKAKPGGRVNARTAEAVKSENKTVIPKGTRLVGHVTQASARAKGDSQSALAIAFDRAVLKNGHEIPLNVSIQALASAETLVAGSEPDDDTVGMRSARVGASGATRGVLGGVSSTASGLAGGAANTSLRITTIRRKMLTDGFDIASNIKQSADSSHNRGKRSYIRESHSQAKTVLFWKVNYLGQPTLRECGVVCQVE